MDKADKVTSFLWRTWLTQVAALISFQPRSGQMFSAAPCDDFVILWPDKAQTVGAGGDNAPGLQLGGLGFDTSSATCRLTRFRHLGLNQHVHHMHNRSRCMEDSWDPYSVKPAAVDCTFRSLPWWSFCSLKKPRLGHQMDNTIRKRNSNTNLDFLIILFSSSLAKHSVLQLAVVLVKCYWSVVGG